MLGVRMHPSTAYRRWVPIAFPAGFRWDRVRFDVGIEQFGGVYPRRLNYAIWPARRSGPAQRSMSMAWPMVT